MTMTESAILGLIQGLTEFLPVSSSGHLALLQHFFGIDGEQVLGFAVLLHVGTLLSIFVVYRRDIWALVRELFACLRDILRGRGPCVGANETRRLGFMIIAATIPTGAVGYLLRHTFERFYADVLIIGGGLVVTGTLLFLSERLCYGFRDVGEMKFRHAFFVGLMQAAALLPGVSRSGATIVGSLFSGLNRPFAVRFAFLISIPSVLGAVVLEAPDAMRAGLSGNMIPQTLLGVAIAAVAGFAAIKAMIRVVSGKRLFIFSVYTWVLGAAVIVYALVA